MKEGGSAEDKFIRNLHKGDFFGEKALSGEEVYLEEQNKEYGSQNLSLGANSQHHRGHRRPGG